LETDFHHVTIASDAKLTPEFESKMGIKGNLVIDGVFDASANLNEVIFNGTGIQTVPQPNGSAPGYSKLIINKSQGSLTLSENVSVLDELNLVSGNLITGETNFIEIGNSPVKTGSVNWTLSSGSILGKMKRWFAASPNSGQASGIFPVGVPSGAKAGTNRYAQVNFTGTPAGGYIIAEYKTGPTPTQPSGLPLTYSGNRYIQNYEEEGYWDITPDSYVGTLNTTTYTLRLRMNNPSTLNPGQPPSGSNGNNIANISNLRIIRAKGGPGHDHQTWELAGSQGAGQTVLANGDYLLEETGVQGFSWFNGGGNDGNPLPVELVSFSGNCDKGVIDLTWQTASEFNSSHFDLEKSRDGENWQVFTTLPSAGNSNELITYQTTDQNATDGNNYFRLRQVDVDGTEKLYDPINVSCSEVTTDYILSFPNPSGSAFQVIVNNKELVGECKLNISDASGKLIETREIEVKDGINLFVINQELTPGIYFLNVSNGVKSTPVLRHAVK